MLCSGEQEKDLTSHESEIGDQKHDTLAEGEGMPRSIKVRECDKENRDEEKERKIRGVQVDINCPRE